MRKTLVALLLSLAASIAFQSKAMAATSKHKEEATELKMKYKLQEKLNKKAAKKAGLPEEAFFPLLQSINDEMADLLARIKAAKSKDNGKT